MACTTSCSVQHLACHLRSPRFTRHASWLQVVARVQHPHQPGQVDWRSFLTTFHELQPLGPVSSPNQHGLASSAEVKAPWLQTQWRPRASDW
jgi:hypothetical protein